MPTDLRYNLEFTFENLKIFKEELKKAKEELDKLNIGTDAFAKKEKQVFLLNQRIQQLTSLTKTQIAEQQRLNEAQEKETAALQKYLGKMEEKNRKELDGEAKIFQQRMRSIQQMEKLSQLQVGSGNRGLITGVKGSALTGTTADELNKTTTASSNAAMALLNLNYVIRDSPYFFQNFALGVLAVGNNLNPLIDSFARLRVEAGTKSISTFALLKQALVGGAGISIAFSVVVTVIQSFVFWMSKSKTEAEGVADAFGSIIDKMIQMKEVGSSFGITPEQLSQRIGAIETMEGSYRQKVERISASPMSKGTQFNEYFVNLFTSRKLTEEEKRQLETYEKILVKLREMKEEVQAQYEVAKILKEAGFDEIKKEEKVKQLKEEQLKAMQSRAAVETRMAGGTYTGARRGFFAGSETNERYGKRQAERTSAFGVGGMVEGLGIELEMGKIAAQELGNALASAFEQGTIKLNEFLTSLTVAIAKMLILRVITGFLTGGIGGGATAMTASASLAKIGNPNLGTNQRSNTINVQGKIYADKNKFVADIENARDYYNNNQKLVTIGRD